MLISILILPSLILKLNKDVEEIKVSNFKVDSKPIKALLLKQMYMKQSLKN